MDDEQLSVDITKPNSAYSVQLLNKHLFVKLLVVVVMMSGFGYMLVPLYKKICEVTGVNVLAKQEVQSESQVNSQIDLSRLVSVELDANVRGPWMFKSKLNHVTVHPGELITVEYEVTNSQPRAITAQAIPSYAPAQATAYFKKMECFCFKQQHLNPSETRLMPVTFYVDSKLPKEIKTITLSYTFFEVGAEVARVD